MLIKVTTRVTEDDVRADFAFGAKSTGLAYKMVQRGTLVLPKSEWDHLQMILERGAKRPVTVVIEPVGD